MDWKYAFRSLWKNPGFTALAVVVMGLGIGANTAVFSVVNTVLLKPLDYHDPDRIVQLSSASKTKGSHGQVSGPDFHDWHDQSSSFEAMAYYNGASDSVVQIRNSAEYGSVASVTPEFFRVFDLAPQVGRLFSQEEEKNGGQGAALISFGYWQSHFGGDPNALGQTLRTDGRTFAIVGILPPRFHFPNKTDIWVPSGVFQETKSRSAHNYLVIGRLRPGISVERAQSEMDAIAARLEAQYPNTNKNKGVLVARVRDEMVGNSRTTLYLLLGAVSLVLLIACANMASLLLAKATARTREIAIRAAIGASRGRIIRQLLAESTVLAAASGLAGLLLALWGSNALVALAPADVPRLAETSIDGSVLAFTLLTSIVASLLFGLAPALQASRADLNDALKARGSTLSGAGRMREMLVVGEIALSVVLLAGAGLLIKSFAALQHVTLGFHPENVLVMSASFPLADPVKDAPRATRFYKEVMAGAAAIPGVTAAGTTWATPGNVGSWGGYWVDHLPDLKTVSVSATQAVFSPISPGTFAALRIPLLAGRDFNDHDTYDANFSAVINQALARQAFPGQNPIGHVLYCGYDSLKGMTIVGVVGDVRQWGPGRAPWPEIYMAYEQHPRSEQSMNVIVRTTGDPTATIDAIRAKARSAAPEAPVKFTTMEANLAENVAAPRFRTLLLAIFAGLAMLLAMAGVYGVMAYIVGQRSNEIGIRMALGATPGSVMGLILRKGLILAAMGLAIGLIAAVAATRILSQMLFEVTPTDPATYAAVAVLLAIVAAGACYFPARRAMKVDPLIALRQE